MITFLAFVVVLGITITIHEFGHFAMAKLLKIKVLVFSLGFGPRIAGFTRGGTEYRLSPFPLGGYVKMAGETFDEERKGEPDEFLSHPRWHRFLVAVAGPCMNILLAIFILAFPYMEGVYSPRYQKEPAVIGPVASGSIADRAGLKSGDRIISVHGNPTNTWYDLEIALLTAPRNALNLDVMRNNSLVQLHLDPPNSEQVEWTQMGFKPPLPKTLVSGVDPSSPAHKAGLKMGDEILSVAGNGKAGTSYTEILNIISGSKGVPLDFKIRRPSVQPQRDKLWESAEAQEGRIIHMTITPTEQEGRVLVGFSHYFPSDLQKFGFLGAVRKSAARSYEISAMTFQLIGRIFKGSVSVRTISGPIEIARMSGSAARESIDTRSALSFFGFLGLISLQLGVFNLLPIPILDGGVIALILIEGLIRRDLSLALKEKIIQVGFVFIILLMGFVVFNDLSKIVNFDRLFR